MNQTEKENIFLNTDIVLLGLPGVGKGTLASKIVENFSHMQHISTGVLLREERDKGTSLGKRLGQKIKYGDYIDDKDIFDLVDPIILNKENPNKFVFDGFPRTHGQLKYLNDVRPQTNKVYFFLQADEKTVIERLKSRAFSSGRFDDSDETVINSRLLDYLQITAPVVNTIKKEYKDNFFLLDARVNADSLYYNFLECVHRTFYL